MLNTIPIQPLTCKCYWGAKYMEEFRRRVPFMPAVGYPGGKLYYEHCGAILQGRKIRLGEWFNVYRLWAKHSFLRIFGANTEKKQLELFTARRWTAMQPVWNNIAF